MGRWRLDEDRQRPMHDNGEGRQEQGPTSVTVMEQDRDTWTGLYDHNGVELHRPKQPIGYRIR